MTTHGAEQSSGEHRLATIHARIASRWAVAALVLASMASCADSPTTVAVETEEPIQLLFNADMEMGYENPVGWLGFRSVAGGPQLFEWADGNAARGQRSLKISSPTALESSFGYWRQRVAITNPTDATFVLTASVKLENVTGVGAAIALRGDDSFAPAAAALVFATTQLRQRLTGTQDWTRISVQLSGVPQNVDQLTVYLLHLTSSTGTVYFDDVSLSVVRNKAQTCIRGTIADRDSCNTGKPVTP